MVDLLFLESGRDAYARRAVWRHDGRVSESASDRNAWRQSTEGAFMAIAGVWGQVVVLCCVGAAYLDMLKARAVLYLPNREGIAT